jgi:hypothetical protein
VSERLLAVADIFCRVFYWPTLFLGGLKLIYTTGGHIEDILRHGHIHIPFFAHSATRGPADLNALAGAVVFFLMGSWMVVASGTHVLESVVDTEFRTHGRRIVIHVITLLFSSKRA